MGKDYGNQEVLADLRPISRSAWFMVAKVDTEEILAEARIRAGFITLAVFLFILLTGSSTAYAYRHRQAHLYKTLYSIERKNGNPTNSTGRRSTASATRSSRQTHAARSSR